MEGEEKEREYVRTTLVESMSEIDRENQDLISHDISTESGMHDLPIQLKNRMSIVLAIREWMTVDRITDRDWMANIARLEKRLSSIDRTIDAISSNRMRYIHIGEEVVLSAGKRKEYEPDIARRNDLLNTQILNKKSRPDTTSPSPIPPLSYYDTSLISLDNTYDEETVMRNTKELSRMMHDMGIDEFGEGEGEGIGGETTNQQVSALLSPSIELDGNRRQPLSTSTGFNEIASELRSSLLDDTESDAEIATRHIMEEEEIRREMKTPGLSWDAYLEPSESYLDQSTLEWLNDLS